MSISQNNKGNFILHYSLVMVGNCWLKQGKTYYALITDCRSLIQDFEEAHLQHTFREGNATADLLAKAEKNLLCPFVYFDEPPLFAVSQVLAECRGVKYPA